MRGSKKETPKIELRLLRRDQTKPRTPTGLKSPLEHRQFGFMKSTQNLIAPGLVDARTQKRDTQNRIALASARSDDAADPDPPRDAGVELRPR